jgi:hypothetical protein
VSFFKKLAFGACGKEAEKGTISKKVEKLFGKKYHFVRLLSP